MRLLVVAPFVGAWIEIVKGIVIDDRYKVAPFVGAWIEIRLLIQGGQDGYSRSVRRSVD